MKRAWKYSYENTTRVILLCGSFKHSYRFESCISEGNMTLSVTALRSYVPAIKYYVTCGHNNFITWRYDTK